MATGRISDLLATVPLLREVDPDPQAVGRMTLAYLGTVCYLDILGQLPEGTGLADRFSAVVQATGDREPLARFWWHVMVSMRATYAYDDPWNGLHYADAIQPIFDAIGGERVYLNMQVFRGMNLWLLGAFEPGRRVLQDIAAADTALGPASSLRRFCLSLAVRRHRRARPGARAGGPAQRARARAAHPARGISRPLGAGRGAAPRRRPHERRA